MGGFVDLEAPAPRTGTQASSAPGLRETLQVRTKSKHQSEGSKSHKRSRSRQKSKRDHPLNKFRRGVNSRRASRAEPPTPRGGGKPVSGSRIDGSTVCKR